MYTAYVCDMCVCVQIVTRPVARCAVERHQLMTSPVSALTSEPGVTAAQIVMMPATRRSATQVVRSLGQSSSGHRSS